MMKRLEIEVRPLAKLSMNCKNGKLTREATYENGTVIAVPLNLGGTIKWFDDSKLVRIPFKKEAEEFLLNNSGNDIRISVLSHLNSVNYICSKSEIKNAKVEVNQVLTISDPNDEDIMARIPYTGLLSVEISYLDHTLITYKYETYQIEIWAVL